MNDAARSMRPFDVMSRISQSVAAVTPAIQMI
jgi:hypothetical protein